MNNQLNQTRSHRVRAAMFPETLEEGLYFFSNLYLYIYIISYVIVIVNIFVITYPESITIYSYEQLLNEL